MITFEEEKNMMTFEEAKDVFLNHGWIKVEGGTYFDGSKWREAVRVLGDYLQREPCEDTISRSKVLEGKVIHQFCDGVEIIDSYAVPIEYIEQLPPVTPQPKMGHWIKNEWGNIECSECGCGALFDKIYPDESPVFGKAIPS